MFTQLAVIHKRFTNKNKNGLENNNYTNGNTRVGGFGSTNEQ